MERQVTISGNRTQDRLDDGRRYHDQDLGQVWTFEGYKKYEVAPWSWVDLPFSDSLHRREYRYARLTKPTKGSILEVGSAMGAGYAFLKRSAIVDVSDYTGIEISDMGVAKSRELYPETKWIQADFTRHELERQYDYVYERIAVHHMPDPLEQFRKMLAATRTSMMVSFRGCVRGETVSDIKRAYFRTRDDRYFCNIINLFEVVELGLDAGFSHIRVTFAGLHERIGTDPNGQQYVEASLQDEKRMLSRFQVRFSHLAAGRKPIVYATTSRRLALTQLPVVVALHRNLSKLAAVRAFTSLA
jgi:SAM-dependent methyltransferase